MPQRTMAAWGRGAWPAYAQVKSAIRGFGKNTSPNGAHRVEMSIRVVENNACRINVSYLTPQHCLVF